MLSEIGIVLKKFKDHYVELFESARKDYHPRYDAYGNYAEKDEIYSLMASLEQSLHQPLFYNKYEIEYVLPSEVIDDVVELSKFIEGGVKRLEDMLSQYENNKKRIPDPIKQTLQYYEKTKKVLDHVLGMDEAKKIITKNSDNYYPTPMNNKVFIVHGHNGEMKEAVARLLQKVDLDPIILHEKPNRGKTIIEKFSDYSDVAFAVVLLSGDDLAIPKGSANETKVRARQNVIFELGYFIGKLGRERVIALLDQAKDFELPSDYYGVLYMEYDKGGAWKHQLIKELREGGLKADANRI